MNWIKNIKPPKFLRYVYYHLYKIALKTGNSTPSLSVAITLAFTHLVQLIFLIFLFSLLLGNSDFIFVLFTGNHTLVIAAFALVFLYLTEKFYQYNDRHLDFIKEFEKETPKQIRMARVYLFVYFSISISLIYIVWFYIIPLISPYYAK